MGQGTGINPFKGVGAARATGGAYTLPGVHTVEIGEIKLIQSQRIAGAPHMLIVEYMVIESTNPEMIPGQKRSWTVNFQHQPALGNVNQFTAALYNCKESDVDEELSGSMVHPSQPGRGTIMKCDCVTIITAGKKQPFNKCTWTHIAKAA